MKAAGLFGGLVALMLSTGLMAEDSDYVNITQDLGTGMALQDVADRAYDNADDYWEDYPGPVDGDDEELSAGEAVTAIYTHANDQGNVDPLAKDIVNVTTAVVNSWPDCQDTFDAVRAAVELEPGRADEIVATIAVKLPQSHLDFLNSMSLFHTEGSYCFAHAGIRPGLPLENQEASDLLWIREEFTRSRDCHEYIVVHGHTISLEVENLPNRIGIDTGAYQTGMLTGLVLEGSEQRLLQTGRG